MDKPGYKTTEFWLSLAAVFVGALLSSGVVTAGSAFERWVGAVASALATIGYTVSRGIVKSGESKSRAISAAAAGPLAPGSSKA